MHIKNQANSPPETRQVTVCVTRRVYNKNHANSLSVKEWPEHVSSEECVNRNANSPSKKRRAQVCVLEVCTINCKKVYLLKYVKAHCDHQNSVQEKEWPSNELPEEIIVNREQLTS